MTAQWINEPFCQRETLNSGELSICLTSTIQVLKVMNKYICYECFLIKTTNMIIDVRG